MNEVTRGKFLRVQFVGQVATGEPVVKDIAHEKFAVNDGVLTIYPRYYGHTSEPVMHYPLRHVLSWAEMEK